MTKAAVPQLTQVKYGLGVLSLSWLFEPSVGALGFAVNLDQGGAVSEHPVGTANGIDLKITLSNQVVNKVWVTATVNGRAAGKSKEYHVIVSAPVVTSVKYDQNPDELFLRWEPVSDPGVAQYIATLTQQGGGLTNSTSSGSTTCFKQTLSSTNLYHVTVRAASEDFVALGPASIGYVPIVIAPEPWKMQYDDAPAQLFVCWRQITGQAVAQYIATLVETGGGLQNQVTSGLNTSFLGQLTDGSKYRFSVRASGPNAIVLGPASEALTPLTVAPSGTTLVWDRSAFVVAWTPIAGGLATEYAITLDTNRVSGPSASVSSPPYQRAQASLSANTVYSTTVRGKKGVVLGPASTAVGPYRGTVTYTLDTQGRIRTEAWSNSTTVSYTMDPAGNITSVTPTVSGTKEI